MPKPKPKAAPEPTFSPASLPTDHRLVRLGPPQGSNQFLAEDADGVESLVDMPAKIRRVAFAARGMFAIVQLYPGTDARVAGEIVHVVNGGDVKAWKKAGEWPKQFDEAPAPQATVTESDDECDLPDNPNRRRVVAESSSDEDSDDEE